MCTKPCAHFYIWFSFFFSLCCCKSVDVLTRSSTAQREEPPVTLKSQIKDWQIQSSDASDDVETHAVTTFADAEKGDLDFVPVTRNPIASLNATKNTNLNDFLSRPTLIDTRAWTTALTPGVTGTVLTPWYTFLNDTVIKNKLANYAFMRARLCLKFVVNATPFHYGLMRVSYEPAMITGGGGFRSSVLNDGAFPPDGQLVQYSQMPGVWLHPANNSGGELKLPFFYHKNWIALSNSRDLKSLGGLTYFVASPLSVASTSGSTSITLDTYAWLEDVELSGTTNTLVLQGRDEYDGPVSGVASAVAKVANTLSGVPVIGRFARATTIGAGAIASIAHMFGFTNTPVITDIRAVQPSIGPQLATSEIGSQVTKLTLDPKQELSVDPALHGIGSDDEMAIANIVSRPSTITVSSWSTSDIVGKTLFYSLVNPGFFTSCVVPSSAGSLRVNHSFLSYLAEVFQHWHGDIVFEVEVICTKFHKGRIRLSWDPVYSGVSVPSENTVYSTILDIGETNMATFTIPYHQATAWLRTSDVRTPKWSTTQGSLVVDSTQDNGAFFITVLTPLSAPVSPQSVGIRIAVRGGDSFEFTNPQTYIGGSTIPPTRLAVQGLDEVEIKPVEITLGDTYKLHEDRYALNFGERIVSLRQLLHRMSLYDCVTAIGGTSTNNQKFIKSLQRRPMWFGFDLLGQSSANKIGTAGTANFNFVPCHPITYLSAMYVASRGGINYATTVGCEYVGGFSDVKVSRDTSSANPTWKRGTVRTLTLAASASSYARFLNNELTIPGSSGSAITHTSTNGVLSWNYPMMSAYNFEYNDLAQSTGNVDCGTDLESAVLEVNFSVNSSPQGSTTRITTYCGTGVDYTCLWLLCTPTMDYYASLPTAV